jgi:hypothetical protein
MTRERGAGNVGGISKASKMPSLSLKVLVPAFWQSFCYWLKGAESNSPAVTAVLVGAYKIFQSTGDAMGWRVNALGKPAMTQLAIDWGLWMGSLCIAIPTALAVTIAPMAGICPTRRSLRLK